MTKCWRCKSAIDTTKVDTAETVGLCQSCWDKSSVDEPGRPVDTMADLEYAQKKVVESLKIPEEYLGANETRPKEPENKTFIEANYSALEMRVAAQLEQMQESPVPLKEFVGEPDELPKKSGVDFVKLQLQNEMMARGARVQDDGFGSPFHKTVGMARLEQALSDAIYQATKKFHNTNDFDSVRDEVKKVSVKTLLDNVPHGFPPPPREVVEKLVDDCLTRQFGPPGTSKRRTTSFRV